MDKIAFVDSRADEKTVYSLEAYGMTVIPTMKLEKLYDAIATHADIQIHYLGNNSFICAPETYEHYKSYLPLGFTLIKGEAEVREKYPKDVLYNAAAIGDYLICNVAHTANEILAEYTKQNKKILNVRQGYSKCNTCVVSKNAIITSDSGIAKAAAAHGIDVLKIAAGDIKLRGMSYGFIGGATGIIDKKLLAVNGDINTHPNAADIKNFCKRYGVEIFSLKNGIPEDIGTVITNIDA